MAAILTEAAVNDWSSAIAEATLNISADVTNITDAAAITEAAL